MKKKNGDITVIITLYKTPKAKLINQKVENTDFKESLGMEIPSKKKIIYLDLVE